MCVVAPLPACICLALPSSERGRLPYLEPGAQTQSSIRHPQYRRSLLKLKYSYKTNEIQCLFPDTNPRGVVSDPFPICPEILTGRRRLQRLPRESARIAVLTSPPNPATKHLAFVTIFTSLSSIGSLWKQNPSFYL